MTTATTAHNINAAALTYGVNITGNAGNNILTGTLGYNDTLIGGLGNDTYVVNNAGDVVTEALNEGTDLIQSTISFTASTNVENLTLTGTSNINATGNSLNNTLTGNSGNNTLDGGGGVDALVGGTGNDTYMVDLLATGLLQDTVTESSTLVTEIDTVQLRGNFTLATSATVAGAITLGTNIENLNASNVTSSLGLLNLVGNTLANSITGSNYNDVITGAGGTDTLNGGDGNDLFIVALTADHTATETINGGNGTADEIRFTSTTASTLTLSSNVTNVENITIGTGAAASAVTTATTAHNINAAALTYGVNITGNAGNNILTGTSFADTLIGNGGTDILNGGAGNDQYNVTAALGSSTITDASGIDTLSFDARPLSSLTYGIDINRTGTNNTNLALTVSQGASTLQTVTVNNAYQAGALGAGALESLSLIGSSETISYSAINGLLGSGSNELIVGFATNDTLTGGGGTDLLAGGAGNDDITGGSGNDILIGGAGIDTFRVDSGRDTIYGLGRGGADIINVSSGAIGLFNTAAAWTATNQSVNNGSSYESAGIFTNGLAVNLSAITSGNAGFIIANVGTATTLTGSALSDVIQGGSGNDTIIGGGGMDFISSGLGNDALTGGIGSDYFIFDSVLNASTNRDTITDFNHTDDTIALSKAIFTAFSSQSIGSLLSGQFWSNTTGLAHDGDDRIIYNTSTGGLFYDSNGSASGGAIQIALLGASTHPTGIDYTDFVIV